MKKTLASLLLISALAFAGCSNTPSLTENNTPPDLVDYIKQYPQYLEEYLGAYSGSVGLTANSPIFVSSFDFKGKNDELIVHARYIVLPLPNGQGKPDLLGYTIYDVKDKTTSNYVKPTIPAPQQPENDDNNL